MATAYIETTIPSYYVARPSNSLIAQTNYYRTMKTIDTILAVTDPVIQEVRRHKRAIAEEFGFDVVALGRSLQERQTCDPRFIMTKSEQAHGDQPLTRPALKDEL
jgi:hypothetical protein